MNFAGFHFGVPPHDETEAPQVATFPFDSQLHVDDLPDSVEYPAAYATRYTVTGQLSRVRQKRAKPISRLVTINGRKILLWRIGHEVFATSYICPHQAGDLSTGDIEDLRSEGKGVCIVCPWHLWRFDAVNGHCKNHADDQAILTTHPTMVDSSGKVFVMFPSFDQSLFSSQDSLEDF
jgi:nitrite reductase (NADH) small subunit